MVAVIFRPEILNYLVLEVLPLGKRELPGLDSQAGETVKVLSKATKINTTEQKNCYKSLILGFRNQNSTRILNTFTVSGAWEAANVFLPVLPVLRVFVVKNNFRFMLFFSGDSIFLFLS